MSSEHVLTCLAQQLYLSPHRQRRDSRLLMRPDCDLGDKKRRWQQSGGSGTPFFVIFFTFLLDVNSDSRHPLWHLCLGYQPAGNSLNEHTKTMKQLKSL